jgi:DNA (cytosine-5)-methyltransferase 1
LPHVSFDEACSDLPRVQEGKAIHGVRYSSVPKSLYQEAIRQGSDSITQHAAAQLSTLDRFAAQNLKQGQNWRHLPKRVLPERFSRIRPYDATTMLKRLTGSLPAYTITTKFNEATTGAFIHPRQARTLTLREAARLQSFPDWVQFAGTAPNIRQQIGNAVPPLLGKSLAESILDLVVRRQYSIDVAPSRETIEVENGISLDDVLRLRKYKPGKPALAGAAG